MKVKHSLTISPRLVSLLGDKMYRQHPLPVVVRELVQNSRDACIRAKVEPDIEVVYTTVDDSGYQVIVSDNGIGMTPDQIIGDFLALGGHANEKDHSHETGGFGLAKVAIMRHPDWMVETLNHRLNQDMTIDEISPQVGTTVTVTENNRSTQYTTVYYMLAMLAFSDVATTFTWNKPHEQVSAILGANIGSNKTNVIGIGENWCARTTLPVEIKELDVTLDGYACYRINGLVQWVNKEYRLKGFNIIVDIDVTNIDPMSTDYPLNTSREEISNYQIRRDVYECVTNAVNNSLTTKSNLEREKEPNKTRVFPGRFISGHGQTSPEINGSFDVSATGFTFISFNREGVNIDDKRSIRGIARLDWYCDSIPPHVSRYVDKLLFCWARIVQYTSQEPFGIGLTTDEDTVAKRITEENGVYYILNPWRVLDNVTTPEGLGISLFHLGVHEVSHYYESSHNEYFTSIEGAISRVISDKIAEVLRKLKPFLSSAIEARKYSPYLSNNDEED